VRAPPVTVLMGVFNGLPHLAHAIRSIQNQTLRDFEFLIIDDASTDGSDRVISQCAQTDPRIRVLTNEVNRGLGAVLHRGVQEARGALVARMDADDVSVPERLERQLNYFADHPRTDVVGSYALDMTTGGTPFRVRCVPTMHDRIAGLVWSNPFVHATVMFRRESIIRVGSYSPDLRRRQDYDLWFRCVHAGLRLANIPEPLVHYAFSEDTVRRNDFRAMWDQVRIGWRGCRLVRAPLRAYLATCVPLGEAMLPRRLRMKFMSIKAKLDPRNAGRLDVPQPDEDVRAAQR
jgi:glycosyltransferase involved in cell wall biosynthesis